MLFIGEDQSTQLTTPALVMEAARAALIAVVSEGNHTFPAVLCHGSNPANRFSAKAGATPEIAGVKVGSYWLGNADRGKPRHNSLILLFNQETGRIETIVEGGVLNSYRTAAADAVAAKVLARPDTRRLSVFGAGNQPFYEILALKSVLPIEHVNVVSRNPAKAKVLLERLAAEGIAADAATAQAACEDADMIVTSTSSREALFDGGWVKPGTHIAAMGADAIGKQELPVDLLRRASLFADLPVQSTRIGEFQRLADAVGSGAVTVNAIGKVLDGTHPGRTGPDEITVFDSSGLALQDLIVGRMIADLHIAAAGKADGRPA